MTPGLRNECFANNRKADQCIWTLDGWTCMLHFSWDTQVILVDTTMNLYFPIQQEPERIVNDTSYYPPQFNQAQTQSDQSTIFQQSSAAWKATVLILKPTISTLAANSRLHTEGYWLEKLADKHHLHLKRNSDFGCTCCLGSCPCFIKRGARNKRQPWWRATIILKVHS